MVIQILENGKSTENAEVTRDNNCQPLELGKQKEEVELLELRNSEQGTRWGERAWWAGAGRSKEAGTGTTLSRETGQNRKAHLILPFPPFNTPLVTPIGRAQ